VVYFTKCDQPVCDPTGLDHFLFVCIYNSNIPKTNHRTTEVYFIFLLTLTVFRDVGIQQSKR
jgi:hypothetical protein